MDWHGERWRSSDSKQVELESRNVSAVELTEFINDPCVKVQNKETSGVTFRFLAWDNEGIDVPLTEMTNTAM